ncbi:hypothetical protein FRC06_007406 [Ceratobasidium sp. 370]|nr:hypothetical protein FRC06_007406 [Ceratobasidium sp. 370]
MHNWASPTPSLSDIRATTSSILERTATPCRPPQASFAAPTHTVPTTPQAALVPSPVPATPGPISTCSPSPQFHLPWSSTLCTSNQVPTADSSYLPGAQTPCASSAGTSLGVFELNGLLPTPNTPALNEGATVAASLSAAGLNFMAQNGPYAITKAPFGAQQPLFLPESPSPTNTPKLAAPGSMDACSSSNIPPTDKAASATPTSRVSLMAAPVAAVAPVTPIAPVVPVAPVGPIGRTGPVGPVGPVGRAGPVSRTGSVGPVGPMGPVTPVTPVAPVAPVAPVTPFTPVTPVAPIAPISTTAPAPVARLTSSPIPHHTNSDPDTSSRLSRLGYDAADVDVELADMWGIDLHDTGFQSCDQSADGSTDELELLGAEHSDVSVSLTQSGRLKLKNKKSPRSQQKTPMVDGNRWLGGPGGGFKFNSKPQGHNENALRMARWSYSEDGTSSQNAHERLEGDVHFSPAMEYDEEQFISWVCALSNTGLPRWVHFKAGQPHPKYTGYVFRPAQLPQTQPRWIKETSYRQLAK